MRSTRAQGDDQAIRGLLQMLGELFRTQRLAELEDLFSVSLTFPHKLIFTTLLALLEGRAKWCRRCRGQPRERSQRWRRWRWQPWRSRRL
jgi:hypothetical protein